MVIKLSGGKLYDPAHKIDGQVTDLYIVDDKISKTAPANKKIDHSYAIDDCIVMAGAIDMHTHIGGGKITIARTMMLEDQHAHPDARSGKFRSGIEVGYLSINFMSRIV